MGNSRPHVCLTSLSFLTRFEHYYRNEGNKCRMYADIPDIISDILKNGAQLAIVSRNTSKEMYAGRVIAVHNPVLIISTGSTERYGIGL